MSSEKRTTLVWLLRDEVSATARKINGSLDNLGVKAKGASGIMGKLGNVTGGLINPMTLGASAIFGVGAALGVALDAGIKDEAQTKRLDAAIKANVTSREDQTKAIDAAMKAGADLALSDDDVKDALTRLLPITKDVSKATTAMKVAADLAVGKQIPLADAVDVVTKAFMGQGRGLKDLGIVVDKATTQTEVLGMIEAKVGGQAQAFADSHEGALKKVGNAWDALLQNVGGAFLTLWDVVGSPTHQQKIIDAATNLYGMDHALTAVERAANDAIPATQLMSTVTGHLHTQADAIQQPLLREANAINGVTAAADDMWNTFVDNPNAAADGAKWGANFGRNLHFQVQLWNRKTIAELAKLGDVTIVNPHLVGGGNSSGAHAGAKASGGPVYAGQAYTVGEHGPETLVMGDTSGRVLPNGSGSGGGAPVTIKLQLDGRTIAQVVDKHLYYALATAPATKRAV